MVGDVGDFERDQPFRSALGERCPKRPAAAASLARMDEKNDYRGWDLIRRGRPSCCVHLVHQWPDDAIKIVTHGQRPEARRVAARRRDLRRRAARPAASSIYVDGVEAKLNVERPNTLEGQHPHRDAAPHRPAQHERFDFDGAAAGRAHLSTASSPRRKSSRCVRRPGTMLAAPGKRAGEAGSCCERLPAGDPRRGVAGFAAELARSAAERRAIKARSPVTLIQEEKMDVKPMANILLRGQYDQPREKVDAGRASPRCIRCPRMRRTTASAWRSGWSSPENPLTARVTVNRLWQEIFGTGMVKTREDFGIMGEPPSHPELLDWLAVEFRESGWDVKHMFTADGHQRHLPAGGGHHAGEAGEGSRQPPAVARPALPHGCGDDPRLRARRQRPALGARWAARASSPTSPRACGRRSACPAATRTTTCRTTAKTSTAAASTPSGSAGAAAGHGHLQCARRARLPASAASAPNTPLQALVTLNDPQFMEAARRPGASTPAGRRERPATPLDFIAPRAAGRPLRPAEAARSCRRTHAICWPTTRRIPRTPRRSSPSANPRPTRRCPPPQLAAWTMVCNADCMNLDEVLNK